MCPDWTGAEATGSQSDFDSAVEAFRQARAVSQRRSKASDGALFRGARTSRSRIRLALRAADRRSRQGGSSRSRPGQRRIGTWFRGGVSIQHT